MFGVGLTSALTPGPGTWPSLAKEYLVPSGGSEGGMRPKLGFPVANPETC